MKMNFFIVNIDNITIETIAALAMIFDIMSYKIKASVHR